MLYVIPGIRGVALSGFLRVNHADLRANRQNESTADVDTQSASHLNFPAKLFPELEFLSKNILTRGIFNGHKF